MKLSDEYKLRVDMGKLQIAICDDEALDLAQAFALLREYDNNQQFNVFTYDNASDLLQSTMSRKFDIVLLDIEMDPPNGFDIAKILIKDQNPPVIIFVTKSNAYALKGYGVAIRYIQKPLTQEDLFEAMDVAVQEAVAHRMTFRIGDITYALRLRDVSYIEVFGHYATVHTEGQSYRIRSSLKEIVSKLPKSRFAVPHNSYVVNLEHIKAATADEIQLNCGAKIPISRRKAQEFNEAFYKFIGR